MKNLHLAPITFRHISWSQLWKKLRCTTGFTINFLYAQCGVHASGGWGATAKEFRSSHGQPRSSYKLYSLRYYYATVQLVPSALPGNTASHQNGQGLDLRQIWEDFIRSGDPAITGMYLHLYVNIGLQTTWSKPTGMWIIQLCGYLDLESQCGAPGWQEWDRSNSSSLIQNDPGE